jgi:2-dehydro-3-deoxygluconokinase
VGLVPRAGLVTDVLVAGGIFREVLVGYGRREVRLAGSGLYAAAAAARLNADVSLVAPVGDDDAEMALALCRDAGVEPLFMTTAGASGTFALDKVSLDRPGPQYRPADARVTEPGWASLEPAVALLIGHPEWDPCASPFVRGCARHARLLWDRQGWLSRTHGAADAAAVPAVDRILLANVEEVVDELGVPARAAMDALPLPGFAAAVIKDGPRGVYLITGERVALSAYDVKLVQSVGTGDVFAGCVAAELARGQPLTEACEVGVAGAAAWVSTDEPLPGADFGKRAAAVRCGATRRS